MAGGPGAPARASPDIAPAGHWPHHKLMNSQSRMTIYQIYSRVHIVTGQRSIPALPCPGTLGLGLPSNRARKGLPDRRAGNTFCPRQGTMNDWYYEYQSEERRSSGQNGTRPCGLRLQMAPCVVARRLFGTTKRHSGHLAWNHLGRQRGDLASLFWPYSFGYGSQSSPAPSRTCSAAASGMLLQYPG